MYRARLIPRRFVYIPGLEPFAFVYAVNITAKKKLGIEKLTKYFRIDTEVVLEYIVNDSRNFKIFVINRMQTIQEYSIVNQSRCITSEDNQEDNDAF